MTDPRELMRRLIPDERVEAGLNRILVELDTLTDEQAAEMRRLHRSRSIECGALTTHLMCAGCDGQAMNGDGPCQHDCHDEDRGPDVPTVHPGGLCGRCHTTGDAT